MITRWNKTDWLVLAGLVLIAAFFRLWRLDETPPGFQFDEAYNAADALRVIAGEHPLFFEANGGREALHIYWIAPFVWLFGPTALALRLASALVGIVTVGLSYLLWRRLLPPAERLTAALAGSVLAVLYWHVHFSRYGIRAILMPLLLIPIVYCLWIATQKDGQREWVIARAAKNWHARTGGSLLPLLVCGALVGLSLYAHPAARFIPILVTLWFGWQFVRRPAVESELRHFAVWDHGRERWVQVRNLFIVGGAAFVVFAPLGWYFLQRPESFFGHPTVVAITDQRVSDGNLVSALGANAARIAGMFFLAGDAAWIHNLSGRPVFDWGIAFFLIVGVVVWARKLLAREALAVLLLVWLPLMLLPTLLSDAAPNFSRAIGVLPALCLLPAWGMSSTYRVITKRLAAGVISTQGQRLAQTAIVIAFIGIFGQAGWATFDDYFLRFPAARETYYAYDVDKLAAAQHLISESADNRVFVPPLLAQHSTFALVTRKAGIKSFDNGEIFVLPRRDGQHGMIYAFPASADPAYMAEFERTYGVMAEKHMLTDRHGKPLLFEYQIAAAIIPPAAELLPAYLPNAAVRLVGANFGGQIHFAGYRITPPDNGEHPFLLTLDWQAIKPIESDYTLFIHLTDASGKLISQRDRRPGNGSYPTTAWSPGDILSETYEVWPKNTPGALQFAVGWYTPADGKRLPVVDANGQAINDNVMMPAEAAP